jgi:hypothetical protein
VKKLDIVALEPADRAAHRRAGAFHARAPRVATVNEALARKYFADREPLGHSLDGRRIGA